MSADPELDELEAERLRLYIAINRTSSGTVGAQIRLCEVEQRIAQILRGER